MITPGKHGQLVPAESSVRLGQALIELIREPSSLAAWGRQARAKCEVEYALARQGADYAALFGSLKATSPVSLSMKSITAKDLRAELCRAQGSQVEWLQSQIESLKVSARELKQRHSPEELRAAAAKLIDTEFKQRKQSSALWFLSPMAQALRLVRKWFARGASQR